MYIMMFDSSENLMSLGMMMMGWGQGLARSTLEKYGLTALSTL